MYIYTSGTTGLPKPAVIKQNRYCAGGFTFFESSGLDRKRDIVYVTLPIYHANGAIIGVGAAIVSGYISPQVFFSYRLTSLIICVCIIRCNGRFAKEILGLELLVRVHSTRLHGVHLCGRDLPIFGQST